MAKINLTVVFLLAAVEEVEALVRPYDSSTSRLHSGTRFTRDCTQNAGCLHHCRLCAGQVLPPIARSTER